jgi:hypothetical protein
MAANAKDLCLSSEVADDLGIAATDRVQRAVTAASQAIASFCGRVFERDDEIEEYPESAGRPLLILKRPPIVSITSITEGGTTVDATTYESTGPNADAGLVLRKSGAWASTQRLDGAAVSDQVAESHGQSDRIVATYDGGYVTPGQNALDAVSFPTVTLPAVVREAAIQTACALLRLKGADPNVKSEAIGDWSVSYFDAKTTESVIPPYAKALLAPYRLAWTA